MTKAFLVGIHATGMKIKRSLPVTGDAYPLIPNKGESLTIDDYRYRVEDIEWDYDDPQGVRVYVLGTVLDEQGEPLLCLESFEHRLGDDADHPHVCFLKKKSHPTYLWESTGTRTVRHECFCKLPWMGDPQ